MTAKQYSGIMMVLWLIASFTAPYELMKVLAAVACLLYAVEHMIHLYRSMRGAA